MWTGKEGNGGWKSVNDVRRSSPMKGSNLCSIEDSADNGCGGNISAFTNAENIERLATDALVALQAVNPGLDTDLMLNLRDIEALAHLGLYSARKFKAALALEQGDASAAAEAMGAGYCHWLNYATVMDSLYIGIETQRNINLSDWRAQDDDALSDYRSVGGAGTPDCDVGGAPVVAITSPADGAVFATPADLTVDVRASDLESAITKVELRNNGALIGTAVNAPYSFDIDGLEPGAYEIEARAYDTEGLFSSQSIVVSVTGEAGRCYGLRVLIW